MSDERCARLAAFIQKELSKDKSRSLDPDTPLVSSGLVDSLSLVKVLVFVEDEFGVVIPDEAATAAAMNTVRLIDQLIATYGARAAG